MHITFNITAPSHADSDLLSLEVSPDTTLSLVKDMIQAESSIPKTSQHIWRNGQLLADENKSMEQLQIVDGDMLVLHVRDMSARQPPHPSAAGSSRQAMQRPQPGVADAETLRLRILGDPNFRAQVESSSPELANALQDPVAFAQQYQLLKEREEQQKRQVAEDIARLNADPFDLEAQMRIEEMIREERVQENLQNAIEHNPEVFGRVHMLYINVEVNGHKVKAFVDSGAQATIMSPSCAEKCGIMRLVDKRFAGIARGVGTANILGRVHSAQIKIGPSYLPCSFTVMEGKDVDLLLGLDMLKRYQASIDLAKDKLIFKEFEVPFLGEADIPKGMEEERAEEPQVPGPGGTSIGGRSGVVSAPPNEQSQTPQTTQTTPAAPPVVQPQAPAASQEPQFPPESIDQLCSLGFSREEVIQALTACDGNVEYAGGLLLG